MVIPASKLKNSNFLNKILTAFKSKGLSLSEVMSL